MLPGGKWSVVVVDPPWPNATYASGGSNGGDHDKVNDRRVAPFDEMSMADIEAMDINQTLADDAWLFLWTTSRFMPDAFELLKAWGLDYCYTLIWDKVSGPKPVQGPHLCAEFIIVGRKGRAKFLTTRGFHAVNKWPRRKYSEKPEEFYELLRQITSGPRLDIFNRRYIDGFWGWGLESPYTNI